MRSSEHQTEVTIQDDQLGLEPEEKYEKPTVRSQNASYENEQWEPCETCKLEVQALLKENKMMKDVLSSMILTLVGRRCFCDCLLFIVFCVLHFFIRKGRCFLEASGHKGQCYFWKQVNRKQKAGKLEQ
ncbi:hypothetical protein Q7C36_005227 [Tachysurus vachellii]|uniref:Uncharacterized protein n=1 Tax=Tachysurus vachellii TaxID=175792 RepID=A0AA88T3I6_TACVA|nr:hypothetical protein Q7C36_005227 [Tachysurus vachellii]